MARSSQHAFIERVQTRLAKELTPQMRRALEVIYEALRQATLDPRVLNLIVAGRTDDAVEVVIGSAKVGAARSVVQAELSAALATAGTQWSRVVIAPQLGVRVAYPTLNAASMEALKRLDLQFFPPILADTRKAFTLGIRTGLEAGVNPREVARSLRSYVGLTEYDARIVSTFEMQLRGDPAAALHRALRDHRFDNTLLRATQGGTIPEATIATMRDAYAQRLHNWRAETWSRTAALNATREANLAAWKTTGQTLGIDSGEIEKGWSTTQDGRQRDEHDAADGIWVGIDEEFPVDGGVQSCGDGVYNCRCVMLFRLKRAA